MSRGTLSDLYVFSSSPVNGMTSCVPILRQDNLHSVYEGAVCIDISASGPLSDYFDFQLEDKFATYFFFNDDDEFNSIENISKSKFKTIINEKIGTKLEKEFPGFWLKEITEITAERNQANIYNENTVFWGQVRFGLQNNQTSEYKLHELTYLVEDVYSIFREFDPFAEDQTSQREITGSKETKLAYFFDGSLIDKRLEE